MKKILLVVFTMFIFVACGKNAPETNNETKIESVAESLKETTSETQAESVENGEDTVLNQVEGYREGNIKAKMITNKGEIDLILFPNIAPKAVENFVTHSKNGYYDGLIFHRVIKDFMIQGGDPEGTGMGGESIWKNPFEDEFDENYRHFTGALSMANAGPGTNGSQFFIVTAKENVNSNIISQMKEAGAEKGYPKNVVDAYEKIGGTYHLDGKHTVFGQVVGGLDVAVAISEVETGNQDKPVEDVVIEKIEIEE